MFTVDGYLEGIAYHVVVGGDTAAAPDGQAAGCATTGPAMTAWLNEQAGKPYKVTPTGPFGVTDLADPASVLGTLYAQTIVTGVEGDAPNVLGEDAGAGVVY